MAPEIFPAAVGTCSTASEIQKTQRRDGSPGQKNFRRGHAHLSRPLKNFRSLDPGAGSSVSGIRHHDGHRCGSFCYNRADVDPANPTRRPSVVLFQERRLVFPSSDAPHPVLNGLFRWFCLIFTAPHPSDGRRAPFFRKFCLLTADRPPFSSEITGLTAVGPSFSCVRAVAALTGPDFPVKIRSDGRRAPVFFRNRRTDGRF